MLFDTFKKSWGVALKENATKNIVIVLLIITNLLAVFGWFRSHETVVLVPPTLDERVRVSQASASAGYKKSWGLYVAELMGNVSPGNVEFIINSLEGIMSPNVYRHMKEDLATQMEDIKEDSLTVSFEPNSIIYEKNTDKVFIYGKLITKGPSGDPKIFLRTYEMNVGVQFGRPWVTYFDVYTGLPRTEDNLKQLEIQRQQQGK